MLYEGDEGHTVKYLAGTAVAILALQRLLPTQLISHASTMTTSLIQCLKILITVMYFIRLSKLPLIMFAIDLGRVMAAVLAVIFFFLFRRHCAGNERGREISNWIG